MSAGYFLVLSHPELYRYMEEDDYRELKSKGILFQTNFASLVGGYGETARKKAEWLLKEGMIDLTGSDLHRLSFFNETLEQSPRKKWSLEQLATVAANPAIK
ncbi:MAG: capsular biosynthesis protein, partial [Muribaculaceae bacterium]|nr:capsular biosynthesis protein [Muribaculaceae bacterium]